MCRALDSKASHLGHGTCPCNVPKHGNFVCSLLHGRGAGLMAIGATQSYAILEC